MRVLGGVQVVVAGRPVDPLPSRALDLLALLASQPERLQPRAWVAARLWPDTPDAQARTKLRRELHHLRRLLGDHACVSASAEGLGWVATQAVEVDVVALLSAHAQALQAVGSADVDGLRRATEVISVADGEFLPGRREDWAEEVRARLHEATVEVCDRATAFWLQVGRPEEALPLAKLRTRLEPLEEPGWLRLMATHRATGDLASAVNTYHRCAALLERELGVGPGEALRSALDEVLDEQAERPRDANVVPPRRDRSRRRHIPFVGRTAELERLVRAWDTTSSAGRRLVVILGEPGVGKTALMTEFAGSVRERGGVVAAARSYAATSGLPLAPLSEWMRTPHLRQAAARLDPAWRTDVERLAPMPTTHTRRVGTSGGSVGTSGGSVGTSDRSMGIPRSAHSGAGSHPDGLARRPGLPRDGTPEGAWRRVRFYESLVRVIAVTGRPVLLTLDDIQWCDRATLSWVAFLLGTQLPAHTMVVATARRRDLDSGPVADWLGSLDRAGRAELLQLDTPGVGDMTRLAEAVLGRSLGVEEQALLRSATGGNPMSVIEATREADSHSGPIRPEGLHAVLQHRLERLTVPELDVAQVLAAVGRDAGLDLLSSVSGVPEAEVARSLDRLLGAQLLVESGPRFDFAHELIREAAYASIREPQRLVTHRQVAEALERDTRPSDGAHAVAVADQYIAAGLAHRALPHLEKGAREARGIFALDVCIELIDRALRLLAQEPPSRSRDEHELGLLCDLLPPVTERLGYASVRLEQAARRAAELSERLGRLADQAEALVTLFCSLFVQARLREAETTARRALELTAAVPLLRGQGHLTAGGAELSLGQFESANTHFEQACALAPAEQTMTNGTHTVVHARAWWAHARHLCGDPVGAQAIAGEAVTEARRLAHPWSLTVALSYQAVTQQLAGDRDGLSETLGELIPLCARYRFAYYDSWAVILDGWLVGGDTGRAATTAGLEGLQAARSFTRMPYWLWLHADVCRRAGDARSAMAALDSAEVHALAHDDLWWLPEVRRARAALG